MEVELKTEGRAREINSAVAITVVALTVIMAVAKIKDDNVVHAMQATKADALDTWNEYQSERLKLHFAEQTQLLARLSPDTARTGDEATAAVAAIPAKIAGYDKQSRELSDKAKALQADYDALNFRHDQFDLSDAGLAVAVSLAAVAALTSIWWLLGISWMFGAGGIIMAVAGFAGWQLHPDWLVAFLT